MKPHKISIKRKKSFNLNYQKNKFVLFINDDKNFDNELPLDIHIADFIKKFTSKKVFKNIALNKSITLDNPITLEPDHILIIKIKNRIEDKELCDFGKMISKFKGEDNISIIWSINNPVNSTARIIQLRSYVFDRLKSKKNPRKRSTQSIFFVDEKKFSWSEPSIKRIKKSTVNKDTPKLCRYLIEI